MGRRQQKLESNLANCIMLAITKHTDVIYVVPHNKDVANAVKLLHKLAPFNCHEKTRDSIQLPLIGGRGGNWVKVNSASANLRGIRAEVVVEDEWI